MGGAKLQGEDLNYLGISGFRIAGGQGVAIIAICQVNCHGRIYACMSHLPFTVKALRGPNFQKCGQCISPIFMRSHAPLGTGASNGGARIRPSMWH